MIRERKDAAGGGSLTRTPYSRSPCELGDLCARCLRRVWAWSDVLRPNPPGAEAPTALGRDGP